MLLKSTNKFNKKGLWSFVCLTKKTMQINLPRPRLVVKQKNKMNSTTHTVETNTENHRGPRATEQERETKKGTKHTHTVHTHAWPLSCTLNRYLGVPWTVAILLYSPGWLWSSKEQMLSACDQLEYHVHFACCMVTIHYKKKITWCLSKQQLLVYKSTTNWLNLEDNSWLQYVICNTAIKLNIYLTSRMLTNFKLL